MRAFRKMGPCADGEYEQVGGGGGVEFAQGRRAAPLAVRRKASSGAWADRVRRGSAGRSALAIGGASQDGSSLLLTRRGGWSPAAALRSCSTGRSSAKLSSVGLPLLDGTVLSSSNLNSDPVH